MATCHVGLSTNRLHQNRNYDLSWKIEYYKTWINYEWACILTYHLVTCQHKIIANLKLLIGLYSQIWYSKRKTCCYNKKHDDDEVFWTHFISSCVQISCKMKLTACLNHVYLTHSHSIKYMEETIQTRGTDTL